MAAILFLTFTPLSSAFLSHVFNPPPANHFPFAADRTAQRAELNAGQAEMERTGMDLHAWSLRYEALRRIQISA